jgi:hypothetical protein
MTTPTDTPAAPTTATDTVTAFLRAVEAGAGIPTEVYDDDVVLDATVPNWRLRRVGAAAVAGEYGAWFAAPAAFEDLERRPTADGEVVTYLLTWTEAGVPHAAHHCHVIRYGTTGRIAADTVFCGGRWPASLLAQIGDAW